MRRVNREVTGVLVLLIFFNLNIHVSAQQTDPYFTESGGFGYCLNHGNGFKLWWCEGAYKVMKDTPMPGFTGDTVRLFSAQNEYEPFQLVFNSDNDIDSIRLDISDLSSGNNIIDRGNIELRTVEYVYVSKPTDSYGFKGWWPDPLPAAGNFISPRAGNNHTVWVSVYIPGNTPAGIYTGKVVMSWPGQIAEIPLKITVWDFSLPRSPSIRSGFGLSVDKIAAYHNLTDRNDIRAVFDLYMNEFRKYRIAPYYFYALSPIQDTVTGVEWDGGYFDSENPRSGRYALRIEDSDPTAVISSNHIRKTGIDPEKSYKLEWEARTIEDKQQFCVLVEGFDSAGNLQVFENRMEAFSGTTGWKRYTIDIGLPGDGVSLLGITLFPAFRTASGEFTGTTWFDNIKLYEGEGGENLIKQGDFEISTDSISISLDFSMFDEAASRYLDNYGFNSFRLDLKGMGSGTYYSRQEGSFAGFKQGTGEYKILMRSYLSQIENHLREKGWLGKEYIYWFDEPGRQDYPFVREGMEVIKDGAPGISTFLTENDPGPEIMDVTDITCTIWHRIDPGKARRVIDNGNEYWSYLCTAPKYPWLSEFIDHDAINLRMWLWGSWAMKLNGILIWSTNYWTSRSASYPGQLQNPWEEPASFVQGYGWPLGKQTQWGNGDGRFFYPPNRDPNNDKKVFIEPPVPSVRLEFLRQGIEDYEYFVILKELVEKEREINPESGAEAEKLLSIPEAVFKDGKTYTLNPLDLEVYRIRVAEMIIKLKKR